MSSAELNQLEGFLFAAGVLSLIASLGFRIRIFIRFSEYPVISKYIRKNALLSFGDLLSVSLFHVRAQLPVEARLTIFWFIALNWSGAALMLLMFVSYGTRNWI